MNPPLEGRTRVREEVVPWSPTINSHAKYQEPPNKERCPFPLPLKLTRLLSQSVHTHTHTVGAVKPVRRNFFVRLIHGSTHSTGGRWGAEP